MSLTRKQQHQMAVFYLALVHGHLEVKWMWYTNPKVLKALKKAGCTLLQWDWPINNSEQCEQQCNTLAKEFSL